MSIKPDKRWLVTLGCGLPLYALLWVNCKVFLDRAAALDHGPGKRVEVPRAGHNTLTRSIESA